jgi:hypothetical protein
LSNIVVIVVLGAAMFCALGVIAAPPGSLTKDMSPSSPTSMTGTRT